MILVEWWVKNKQIFGEITILVPEMVEKQVHIIV